MRTNTGTRLAASLWLIVWQMGCTSRAAAPPDRSPTNSLPLTQNFDAAGPPPGWQFSGNTVVSGARAYSGDHALKITSGNGKSRNYASYDLQQLAAPTQQLYGSMMVYLDEPPSSNDGRASAGDFTLVQAEGSPAASARAPADTNVMYRARIDGRHDHLMANYDTRNPANSWQTDCWKQPTFEISTPPAVEYRLPKKQWACLRWHFDASRDQLAFWLNDAALPQIHVDKTGDGCIAQDEHGVWRGPGQFRWLRVGVEQYHSDAAARTLFIDNLKVDVKPVECDEH